MHAGKALCSNYVLQVAIDPSCCEGTHASCCLPFSIPDHLQHILSKKATDQ